MGMVKKFEVYFCDIRGQEKPCVILSPDEMNALLPYVLVAPITKAQRNFPCRMGVKLKGEKAQIALDLIRCISQEKLLRRTGVLPDPLKKEMQELLKEFFDLNEPFKQTTNTKPSTSPCRYCKFVDFCRRL